MTRVLWLSGFLPVLFLIGCAEQPKPAAPPSQPAPMLGAPSISESSPAAPEETPGDQPEMSDDDRSPTTGEGDDPSTSEKTAESEPSGSKPKPTAAKTPAGPTQVQFNLNHVTDEFIAALVLHPKRALESPVIAGLKEEGALTDDDLQQAFGPFLAQTGLDPKDIEELAVLIDKRVLNSAAREAGLPVEGEAPGAAKKGPVQFKNNMKQVGLAFHNYHDVYNYFPAAGGSGDGENRNGFSWRAQMAPFVDAAPLYNAIQFDQEWDSDDNAAFHEQMPESFQSSGVTDAGKTSIHVITGEGTPFQDDKGSPIRAFIDGTSNSILAVSAGADTAEIWMKPGGLEFDPENPTKCLGTIEDETFLVLWADGSVRPMSKNIDPAVFAKLVTVQDGEAVDLGEVQQPAGASAESTTPFGLGELKPDQAPVFVLKTTSPVDHALLLSQLPGSTETKSHEGHEYFFAEGWAMAFPTEQTAVFSGETALQAWLAAAGKESESALANQLRAADQPFDALLTLDLASQKDLMQFMAQQNPLFGPFANLKALSLTASSTGNTGDLLVALNGLTTSPQTAQTLAAMVNGLALNQLKMTVAMQSDDPSLSDSQREFLGIFKSEIELLEMKSEGNQLTLQISMPDGFDRIPQILAPEIKQAREAAAQMQKLNNLRQIALAFHSYEATYRRFPKAGGPAEESDTVKDGLSWRVHLLPFLDQVGLYNEFKLDEPWDSEHNKALIEKMPDIFKADGVEDAGKTSIHVFTGEGAPFADNAAPGLRDFTDGTSNTLLCVTAGPDKADIWTKPGGLEADPEDPFAALGEIGEKFQAIFTDGSARYLSKLLDPVTLRNLIQHQDGNPIESLNE